MIDQLIGLVLIGLGIHNSVAPGDVKGDTTEVSQKEDAAYREEYRRKVEKRQEELKAAKTKSAAELKRKITTEKEQNKERLEKVRDTTKRASVEKLLSMLTQINARRTTQMTERLAHLKDLLAKLSTRTDEASQKGIDVSAVTAAITSANSAIATAELAVTTQATKTYPVSTTSDSTVKSVVSGIRSQMQTDLKTTHDFVKAAVTAVRDVVVKLGEAIGESVE